MIAGPTFAFYGFGLCLYFASQGSGRMLGPVLAQGVRLVVVAVGAALVAPFGWSTEAVFALIAVAFVAYGIANAVGFQRTDWSPRSG
jgi:Na+-driven multidrug efflux pump